MWSKSIHYFYSQKNRQYFWCESMLERDALLLMEFDSDIVGYKTQPISIQYKDTLGEIRRYTPDYLFKRKSSEQFVFHEVKMAERVDDALMEKISLINHRLREAYGSRLEIITNEEVRVGSRIDNLETLYPYKRVLLDMQTVNQIISALPTDGYYGDLIQCARTAGVREVVPLAILAHGYLSFNAELPLSVDTKIVK